MVKSTLTKLSPRLLRNSKLVRGMASDSIGMKSEKRKDHEDRPKKVTTSANPSWIPHPRTGIFYPQGQEWVMHNIPEGAAIFEETYWLRNSEGCDKYIKDYSFEEDVCEHNLYKSP